MKKKSTVKIIVDILMTLALLGLMGYHLWGDFPHELFGVSMFILFIVHNILNLSWYKSLFKGRYTPLRIVQLVVNILITVTMIAMIFSAVIISRYVFAFIPIDGGMEIARRLHILGSHWSLVLLSLHLGLHWHMILRMGSRGGKNRDCSKIKTIIFALIALVVAGFGVHAFAARDLLTYLLLRTEFVFLDYNESIFGFYLDYIAIMGLFIVIGHYAFKGLKLLRKKNN